MFVGYSEFFKTDPIIQSVFIALYQKGSTTALLEALVVLFWSAFKCASWFSFLFFSVHLPCSVTNHSFSVIVYTYFLPFIHSFLSFCLFLPSLFPSLLYFFSLCFRVFSHFTFSRSLSPSFLPFLRTSFFLYYLIFPRVY